MMEGLKDKEHLQVPRHRARSSHMRNNREGIVLETSSFSQERDSGISNPTTTNGSSYDYGSRDHTLVPPSGGVRSPMGYGSLASRHTIDLPTDLEDLKVLHETLKKQKQDLLKGKERTELTLEILRLHEEISSLRSECSSREALFPRPPHEWISTLGSTTDATSFDMPYVNYEAQFERCLGYPESCITREDEFTDCQSLPDPLSDDEAQPDGESPALAEKCHPTVPERTARPVADTPDPAVAPKLPAPEPELCSDNQVTESHDIVTVQEGHQSPEAEGKVVTRTWSRMGTRISCCSITFHSLAFLVLAGVAVIHVLAWYPTDALDILHKKERESFWRVDGLEFLPAAWVFWIWVGVYVLQVIWMIYAFTAPWRNTSPPDLLFQALSYQVYLLMLLGNGCVLAWIYLWDQLGYVQYSIICIATSSFLSYLALGQVAHKTHGVLTALRLEVPCDLAMIQLLVLNGIAAYATWTLMLTRSHMSIIINQYTDLEPEIILYIYIAFPFAFLIIWFMVDILAVKRAFSYVFTPYILPIVVAIPLLLNRDQYKDLHFILTALVTALFGLIILIKLAITIGRERSHPPATDTEHYDGEKFPMEPEPFHFGSQSDLTLPRECKENEGFTEKY